MYYAQAYLVQQLRREAATEDPVELDETDPAVDEPLPDLPTFANQVAVNRRSTRIVDGASVEVFDLTSEVSDGDGGTTRLVRTIALMTAAGRPPKCERFWNSGRSPP